MLIPHPQEVGKNSGRISQEQGVPALIPGPSLRFQRQENKSTSLLAAKTSGLVEETSGVPSSSS